jgi:hypothetical protein
MTATVTMSRLSTQYVLIPVQATVAGEAISPAGFPVAFQFAPVGTTPTGSWTAGSWQDGTTNGFYMAQCLIGPENGGLVLAPALYAIWIQITGNPEVPVLQPGLLQVVQ